MWRPGEPSQPPRVHVCSATSDFWMKAAPPYKRAQRPQHRVSLPGRYTECHPTCRRGTQALAGASTGLRGLEVSPPPQISRHWQRGIHQKICCLLQIFRTFWKGSGWLQSLLYDYGVVNLSHFASQRNAFYLLLCVLLIHFLPKFWRTPSPSSEA